jgi:predicted  nucleic acid-binding Zn-ribbon protein
MSRVAEALLESSKREANALEARLEASNAELADLVEVRSHLEAELEKLRGRNEHREELLGRIASLAGEMSHA